MVGIVLVSHSRALALAVQELVRAMTGPALRMAVAAGVGENQSDLGTDAVEIAEAITSVSAPEGVLVLMDMGSAILSAETALDLLNEPSRVPIRFCPAPFVEGAVAAGVTANLGASLEQVYTEALAALKQKQKALASNEAPEPAKKPEVSKKNKAANASSPPVQTIRLKVRNSHGLHARPAARLITETRPFQAEIMVRNLSNQRGPISIRSLSSLASLEILQDNEIEVSASGADAGNALQKISRLIESGLGDDLSSTSKKNGASRQKTKPEKKESSNPIPVFGGLAIGSCTYFKEAKLEIPENKIEDVPAEIERLRNAVTATQKTLEARSVQMNGAVGKSNAGIYEAQILALQDPELIERAIQLIRDEKINAALAWNRANQKIVRQYEALQDVYLRERATDLEDVGRQVLEGLAVKKSEGPKLVAPGILIADNLTPFQVSALPRKLVLGAVLLDGGPTAHSSILLKALGIPTLVQARSALNGVDLTESHILAFNGSTGKTWIDPDPDFLAELKNYQADERQRAEEEMRTSSKTGATLDGHRVEIFANIGNPTEVEAALDCGAEGVGLFRTEFLFLERDSAPTEKEQMQALLSIAEKLKGKPLIVRTLDVGGDKQLPYLSLPTEENPFLGVRAIRLSFSHEELFATQLRAILRAGHGHDFRIMFPMIANLPDLLRARKILEKIHDDLEKEKVVHLWPIQVGIMIEIPSAALQADLLAKHVDFFSIGTNDLTQYTLAADRGNPDLASYQDALHPSVLRLIEMVVTGAAKYNRLVAVCGEAASDEIAAALFVGLGVGELSVTGAKIPHLKAILRKKNGADLQRLAHRALNCQSAVEVRALVSNP